MVFLMELFTSSLHNSHTSPFNKRRLVCSPPVVKMFMKLQHSDINCLQILNSIETTPRRVGLSLSKPSDKIRLKQHKIVPERVTGGQIAKENNLLKNPCDKIDKNVDFGRGSGNKNGIVDSRKTGGLKIEGAPKDDFLDNRDTRSQIQVIWKSTGGFNGILEKSRTRRSPSKSGINGAFGKEKATQFGYARKSDGRVESNGKGSSNTRASVSTDSTHAKCSTKWARYGGCVPAMLEAVEKITDLDEALKPWELSFTNKERSILLKEQLRWERAMEIFEWFKRKQCYELNVIHYNIMIRILGKSQRWCEVESLCGEMGERGIELINSTYGTLIDVYCKGGLRQKAMKWLELMDERKMEPDEVTMGIVVQMYKKAGEFKSAEDFFNKWSCSKVFVNTVRSMPGRKVGHDFGSEFSLSAHTYNTLIDTYGKAGKFLKASETFVNMLKKGIRPTTVTFNSLMHMYGNNGQLGEVSSLMHKMEKVKCAPDTRTYNILISLYAKHNDIELAARYFKKMKNASIEPDTVTYRTLLYAFSIRHMVSEAEELIAEMDERGLAFAEYTQSSLTRMYVESGLLQKSSTWFQRFHLEGNMTSECYSANIDAFGDRGYIFEAEKVFNCCLEAKKLNVLVFNVMIKAYGVCKNFEQACNVFDSMKMHSLVPDRCSYNSLVQLLASADLPKKGEIYLKKMQEAGLVIDCVPYCAVISSYAKLGHLDMAVGLYEEMINCWIKPDVIVFGVLINAFADSGSVKEAKYYVDAMTNLGLPMNIVVCKSLIKLYTKVGYLKEAQEAYGLLQSLEVGHDAYSSNCMIDLFSERSMVSEAEEIFENMKRRGTANEFTYAMMLCMYKRNGRFLDAFWIARKMRELRFMTDLLSYNNVLGLYACDGRFKEASATFNEMQKSCIQPDDCTFKSLGIILLKCGVPKDAIEKLDLVRKKDMQSGLQIWSSTLSSVIDVENHADDM